MKLHKTQKKTVLYTHIIMKLCIYLRNYQQNTYSLTAYQEVRVEISISNVEDKLLPIRWFLYLLFLLSKKLKDLCSS